jgi:hypothetical protein
MTFRKQSVGSPLAADHNGRSKLCLPGGGVATSGPDRPNGKTPYGDGVVSTLALRLFDGTRSFSPAGFTNCVVKVS